MTNDNVFDLIVVGGTPAGLAAAIGAARLGKRSLILERTAHLGGLPANGLGATDIATRGATGGLFVEFVHVVKAYYAREYGVDSQQARDCSNGYHFEPKIAEEIFQGMLDVEQGKILTLTKRQFDFAPTDLKIEDGRTIQAIHVLNLETGKREMYHGRFFIDATYEGDLIGAAGVPYHCGREGQEVFNEPGAGRVYKLWRGPECEGTTFAGDNAIQAFNYRLCLTDDPQLRVKFIKPKDYRREDFVSLVHDVRSGLHTGVDVLKMTPAQIESNLRRADQNLKPEPHFLAGIQRLSSMVTLPNRKTDGNNQHHAFISTDLPEENWPYPTSSWTWRDAFAARLRSYTEGLFYFAANDPELPLWFREEVDQWGWARDEYTDNDFFPRQIYVREGRRMQGKYFFAAKDALALTSTGRPPVHEDSITASHYALDSHAVRKREEGRCHLDGFISYPCAPYTVPYGVMVPDAPIANLLAPVPVSASHIGFSTLRMEPCWMALGQAAGVAAAMCLDDGCASGELEVERLQEELLEQGAVLYHDERIWETKNKAEWKRIQVEGLKGGEKGLDGKP